MNILERVSHGWNAFMGRDPTPINAGYASYYRPDRVHLTRGNERSIINATLNRIAVDVASTKIEHVRLDDAGRYKEPIVSYLNRCLTLNANNDQTARAFIQDVVMSMLDEGVVAIVPTSATEDPRTTEGYDIGSLRVGKVTQWYPYDVKVLVYNEQTGKKEERIFPKRIVALPENPFFSIMNEPNSVYQRLVSKLRALDIIDDQSSSGKLDLILQVPYSTRSTFRKDLAEKRRGEIESQLTNSKYGVAYIDASEKVIQLNRAIENNLFTQVEYYTNMLHSQLGMPPSIFDGTADEATKLNYQSRTIEPILSAIVDAMKWKFLSQTARTRGQSIAFFNEPLKLAPAEKVAEIADKFIRNEVLTANEVRGIIGFKPAEDTKADELRNPNMPAEDEQNQQQNEQLNNVDKTKPVSEIKSG